MLRRTLPQRFRRPVQITFDWQTHRATGRLKFAEAEIPQLLLKALDEPKEGVLAVELGCEPSPLAVGREILHLGYGVSAELLLAAKRWQFLGGKNTIRSV